MLSNEGDELSAVLVKLRQELVEQNLAIGLLCSNENVSNVERKQGYKIRELNYQEGDVAGVKP